MPQGAILTNVGLSKISSATPLDQLNVVQVAVGDGNGGYPALTPDMTGLVNEVWRGAASNPIRDPNNANVLIFESAIPASAGPFTIREQAIFDAEGDMIAIGQTSVVEKPDPNESVGLVATMRLHIALSNAEQVDLFYTDTTTTHHNSLTNRDDKDSHPASAISQTNGRSVQHYIDNTGTQGEWVSGTSYAYKDSEWWLDGVLYKALQNTSVDPVGDNVNWRIQPSVSGIVSASKSQSLFTEFLSKFRQFGHRGSELSHPENTLSSINACRGIDGAEFDVRLTSDGVWCLMHDTHLNRTTTGLGPIALNSFSYVRSQDAGSWFDPYFTGSIVPTLSEALNVCKQANLTPMVELKALGNTAQNTDLLGQCKKYFSGYNFIIAASDQSWLEAMREIDPFVTLLRFVSGAAVDRITELREIYPCIVSVEKTALTEADIKKYHDEGFITYVHTLEGNDERDLWMSRGVDGVLSNNLTGIIL